MAPFNPDEERTMKRMDVGTVSSGDATEDRISSLSDGILCLLLMLLSVRDAARTTVLSSRWKDLLKSREYQPISIDDNDLWIGQQRPRSRTEWSHQLQRRSDAITASLAAHRGSIKRFIIRRTWPLDDSPSRWLQMLSENGIVEELFIKMPLHRHELPHFILNCSSLRSLSLCRCAWPLFERGYSPEWTLARLTELTLRSMKMAVRDIENLLQRCPVLLSLAICRCNPNRSGSLRIQCENLVSLTIEEWNSYLDISTWHVPKLERILWWPETTLFVISGVLEKWTPMVHTIGIFEALVADLVEAPVKQVRTIALCTDVYDHFDVQQTFAVLHKLPHLETLHLQLTIGSINATRRAMKNTKFNEINFEEKTGGPVACLENSVKTIVLRVPNLVHKNLVFANFLLRAAKALKVMRIGCKSTAGDVLGLESRGSSDAQVVFLQNGSCSLQICKSASNFKLPDPFMP